LLGGSWKTVKRVKDAIVCSMGAVLEYGRDLRGRHTEDATILVEPQTAVVGF